MVLQYKRFSGGIYLEPGWGADNLPVEMLPAPSHVTIPLIQHAGTPAEPTVRVGDHVAMGCQIGIATAADAVPVHASVSGIVTKIARYPYSTKRNAVSVTIENDGNDEFSTPIPYDKAWRESAPADIVEKIHLGGIIDNGFPLADRLSQGRAGRVDTLLINALSTEGYCSADARLLIEQPRKAALGITICKYAVGATKCLFVIDENRTTVVDAVSSLMADEEFNDCDCSVLKIKKARYPLHNERLLLAACRGVELPAGALPAEAGCAVIGIAAAVAVAEAVTGLTPLIRRIVTVGGPLASAPKNLLVPIGTSARRLLDACKVDIGAINKLIFGGALSGRAVQDLETPISKSVNSLLPLAATAAPSPGPCIGCRRCRTVCPMRLEPARLSKLVIAGAGDELDEWHIAECIECGCCAYVCPSGINLVQHIAYGKLHHERSPKRTGVLSHEAAL